VTEASNGRRREEMIAHDATSYWLRHALRTALERDPFDAMNDALDGGPSKSTVTVCAPPGR
jgi:hypothetical protein